MGHARPLIAFAVFTAWLVATAFTLRLFEIHKFAPVADSLKRRIEPGLIAALLILAVAIVAFGWRDLGLNKPRVKNAVRLLWLPALYVVCFLTVAVISGLPPAKMVLLLAINVVMVGISEELACRGILYRGFRGRMGLWPAMLLSTFLFGGVHIVNGFTTGDFGSAAVQAVSAFMSGVAFMAIRLRTGSLYPGMALHAAFDFSLILSLMAGNHGANPSTTPLGIAAVLVPMLFVTPNFIYGLYLLRNATRDECDYQSPNAA